MGFSRVNRQGPGIIKLNANEYIRISDLNNGTAVDAETGEIVETRTFERTENRGDNLRGMRQSMKKLRDLINCNVVDPNNCRWVTLTYAENMTDRERLMRDHQKFMQRLKRYHKKHGLPDFEYINAVEPQGRGAWHVHSLWIYPCMAPYLPNTDDNHPIRDLWGQGWITIKKLDNVDNVGAYLTAYLCDIEVSEADAQGLKTGGMEIKTVEISDGKKLIEKKYIKGGRMHLYPSGMQFFRASRGVKRPEVEWTTDAYINEKVGSAKPTFSKGIKLSDDDGDFTSEILYEYYNKSLNKNQ